MLDKKAKNRIIKKYKIHESDTGSSSVQIAILTEEIKELAKHLKMHKKDFSSRRGLLRKVSERRKLLHYLQREDHTTYEELAKDLKLKVVLPERLQSIEEPTEEDLKKLDEKKKVVVSK